MCIINFNHNLDPLNLIMNQPKLTLLHTCKNNETVQGVVLKSLSQELSGAYIKKHMPSFAGADLIIFDINSEVCKAGCLSSN